MLLSLFKISVCISVLEYGCIATTYTWAPLCLFRSLNYFPVPQMVVPEFETHSREIIVDSRKAPALWQPR